MALGVEFGFQRPRWKGFKALDASDAIRTGFLITVGAVCVLYWPTSAEPHHAISEYAAVAALWFGLVLTGSGRSDQVWQNLYRALKTPSSNRSPKEARLVDRGLLELFIHLLGALVTLATFAFISGSETVPVFENVHLRGAAGERSLTHVAIYCAFFGGAFVPILLAIGRIAVAEAQESKSPLFRKDVVSRNSLLTSLVAISGILGLAWAAGAGLFSIDQDLGVIIYLVVIIAFLVFIIAPHVTRRLNENEEARDAMRNAAAAGAAGLAPERLVSWFDSLLVRFVAPLSGATQKGAPIPHLLVVGLILPLSAIGFVLSSPFGLIPISLAMLVVVALGRRWAWVEADRETASRLQSTDFRKSREIHIGFDNDLKDEALLGYVSFFILVPLALFQIEQFSFAFAVENSDNSLANMQPGEQFYAWISFFGAELAKAVPFVDWWEIYQVEVNTPIEVSNDVGNPTLAKHLTFAARALVDLVIMAALFQAFSIWQRGRAQQRLYNAGHINAFDPFTEQEFFERGMKFSAAQNAFVPKQRFRDRVAEHVKSRQSLRLPALPYSSRRLSELLNSPNEDLKEGAKWMVSTYRVLAGTPAEQLSQLAEQWREPFSFTKLYARTRSAALHAERIEAKNTIRNEKLKFERLLDELIESDSSETGWFGQEETGVLLELLQHVRNAPEFVYAHSLAIEFLSGLRGQYILYALASHTLTNAAHDTSPVWRERITLKFGRLPNLVLGRSEMRQLVYDAMDRYGGLCHAIRDDARLRETIDFLELMAETDAAAPARSRAAEVANRLKNLSGGFPSV